MKHKVLGASSDEMPADVSDLVGWKRASRVLDPGKVKLPARRITINLDADIVATFKAEALHGGPPYQVAINQALRKYLRDREAGAQRENMNIVLTALEDSSVRKKIRQLLPPLASPRVRGKPRRSRPR